jgi:hypothetical protein
VYYNCGKFHKNPIRRLGGVALTRYTTPLFDFHEKKEGMYLVSATPPKQLIGFL